jgi:lipopolysaccharide export system permease protein
VSSSSLRIQIYVLRRSLIGVGAALAVVSAVIVLVNFVELSRTLGGRIDLPFFETLALTALKSPTVVLQLMPFVFLFGVMGAFVTLNRAGELVAMRASGVSAWRFVLPAAAAAFVTGLITVTTLNPAAAALNGRFEDRRAALAGGPTRASGQDIWLRQGDDGEQIVIHAKSHETVRETVRLNGVSLFIQRVGPSGVLDFSRRIEAARAVLSDGSWRLGDVREAMPGAASIRSEQLVIPSLLDHRSAMEKLTAPGSVAFWRLPNTIRMTELAGYSAVAYRLRFQQLLATPLLFAAMALLAAAFSLRLMRLGHWAGLAGIGVAVGFIVFFAGQFCAGLSATEVIPPFMAAWSPPLLALLSGVTLLCYTEDG